ncbi:MAG: leucine-rich repeat protein [Ruminococcus sp.]|nr:leucine-rich repeat protein [Ruminococcus sp.]
MKNSRKILSGIMALCLMCGMAVVPTVYAEETKGEETSSDDTAKVEKSGKWGKSGTWSLEDGVLTINGEKTFGGLGDKLTKEEIATVEGLIIGEGITDISTEAFKDYKKLVYVTFPETLENIGDSAFCNCTALYDIEFPQNLKAIGESAFSGNWSEKGSMTNVVIPDSVTGIGKSAFEHAGIASLEIGRGVTSIGSSAFSDNSIGKAKYRGTEKEWKAIKIGNSFSTPFDVEYLVKAGDANGDGEVSLSDAVFIMQCLANPDDYSMDEILKLNADVVDVGSGLTTTDALVIQMIGINLVKMEDLPITSKEVNNITG